MFIAIHMFSASLPLDKAGCKRHQAHMLEIFRSTDPTEIAFATALLQGEGIEAVEFDLNMSVLEGGIGIFPRRLMVREKDHFIASAVLRDNDLQPSARR